MNTSRWKEPRNLLILLGFICQGYNLIPYVGAIIYALVWFVCLKLHRERRLISNGMEDVLTLIAIVGTYMFGQTLNTNALVFIGNGMIVFQAVRLLRPLNLREKMYSIAVALIHLGVGSQYVVDYEFILILAAAIYLVPRSLFDLEAEKYRRIAAGRHAMLNRSDVTVIVVMMLLFFLLFPRFQFLAQANPIGRNFNQQQPDELDTPSGGQEASEVLLFRIEGRDISYIKQTALDTFDGVTWSKSNWMSTPERPAWGNDTTGALRRSVKIGNPTYIDNNLPVDGYVLDVDGPFVQRPYIADHGGLMLPFDLNRPITYTYYTTLEPQNDRPMDKDLERYSRAVPPSAPLTAWLDDMVGDRTDPEAIATRLADHFQENHDYELGAPDLDRMAPIDDFVLNQRDGHCERFASSLAYLLRLRGIPSRVALGWLATERNNLGEFYNVRARHGHAWTEAWIEGKGWVIFDGTPYGSGDYSLEDRSLGLTIYEWIEFIWYSKIVEFDAAEQTGVFQFVSDGVSESVTIVLNNLAFVILVVVLFGLTTLGWRTRVWERWKWQVKPRRQQALIEAQHFYGKLLRHLAKQRHYRQNGQTPLEFLNQLEAEGYPQLAEVRDLTRWFCDIRYGHRDLTPDLRQAIHQKLARIAKNR